ncbi:MAG: CotH kinase family protein [Bacteroidaceae bacterium]
MTFTKKFINLAFFSLLGLTIITSCSDDDIATVTETTDPSTTETTDPVEETDSTATEDYSDWTEATHSKNVDPNFEEVFDESSVMRVSIKIASDTWENMQSNLATVLGSSSNSGAPAGPGGPGGQAGPGQQTDESGYVQNTSYDNPDWYSCSLYYNDKEWYHVGIRYKGNSSLQNAYQQGDSKLSFKFSFDKFEDDYPDLKNQRFYGFKQLNLNNNFNDESFMREKVTADLFRSFGVPAAHTRFCAVYVDHGDGEEFFGVYTLLEEVDDTVIDTQFSDNDGNLYKPDGNAASFGAGTYNEEQFVKKTNEDEADFTDVSTLYTVLNDTTTRIQDPALWRTNLESILNMPEFLKWLAANTVIQNWDTYGNMTHNYFLYNNPDTQLLSWIPWDNNEALENNDKCLSLSLSEVSSLWPLINYVMTQSTYKTEYESNLTDFATNYFSTSKMDGLYSTYYDLLKDYASEEGNSNFSSAVEKLKEHVASRTSSVLNN